MYGTNLTTVAVVQSLSYTPLGEMSAKMAAALASRGLTLIHGAHNATVKHLVKLREKKGYRIEQGSALVQGKTTIQELLHRGIKMKSIVFTVSNDMEDIDIDRKKFPAERYFACDINNTRKILGTASRPVGNEMFAQVELPHMPFPASADKLIVFNKITDPGNLGTLVRTAKALGWGAALVTDKTCDMNNDKTIRASKAAVIDFPYKIVPANQMMKYIEAMHLTPVVADTLPRDLASFSSTKSPLTALTLWKKASHEGASHEIVQTLPDRIALILSSEHHGPSEIGSDVLRISIGMESNVESLNVASAGAILLFELNQMKRSKPAQGSIEHREDI